MIKLPKYPIHLFLGRKESEYLIQSFWGDWHWRKRKRAINYIRKHRKIHYTIPVQCVYDLPSEELHLLGLFSLY